MADTWAQRAVDAVAAEFGSLRDPDRARAMSRYMRDQFPFLGIPSAPRRAAQRRALAALPPPTADHALAFAEACWSRDPREYQYAGADLIRHRATRMGPDALPRLEALLTTKSWWDTVDTLAVAVGTVVRRHPDTRAEMDRWLESSNTWLVRVAILHQERWRADTDAAWLFQACRRHATDTDFFIRKAIGWALRSYARTDPVAVRAFLADHGGELSGLSVREATRGVARADSQG